jgi:hypothetical protein
LFLHQKKAKQSIQLFIWDKTAAVLLHVRADCNTPSTHRSRGIVFRSVGPCVGREITNHVLAGMSGTGAADGAAAAGMSDYELQRLEHIRRNNEYLAQLGLASPHSHLWVSAAAAAAAGAGAAATALLSPATTTAAAADALGRASASKTPRTKVKLEPTRRSSRMAGAAPQYTGEIIDTFFGGGGGGFARGFDDDEEEDDATPAKRNRRGITRVKAEPSSQSLEHLATTLDLSRQWLAASRSALLQVGSNVGGGADGSSGGGGGGAGGQSWRQEAVRRWGPAVPAGGGDGWDWEVYVRSRLSTGALPPSELDLLQEYYCHDSWRLLVCCALMSRVSSWKTKSRCAAYRGGEAMRLAIRI